MKRSSLGFALAVGLASSGAASAAMEISADGRGQVLLFPYYTVNAGNSTLLSLVNHTDEVKALKIRFREAMNGRGVLDFNIYLPPRGNWRGALVASDANGPAWLTADRFVCTAPLIPEQGVAFRNAFYSGSRQDDGPDSLARTREGFVEVIEMGVVVDDGDITGPALPLPDAAGNLSGIDNHPGDGNVRLASDARFVADDIAANCVALVTAWESGVWSTKPTKDIDEPSGGISGTATIVDVASGVSYGTHATVIDGFFTVANSAKLHTPPGALEPTLASAQTWVNGPVEARGSSGDVLHWKQGTPDAVSSLLTYENLGNRFQTDGSSDADSEWVVTFPTKQLHMDGDAVARRPFTDAIDDAPENAAIAGNADDTSVFDPEGSCEPVAAAGRWISGYGGGAKGLSDLCFQANVIAFNQASELEQGQSALLGSRIARNFSAPAGLLASPLTSSHAELRLGDADNFMLSEPQSSMRTRLFGLPAIGFWAARFINAQAQPGVLASYAVSMPHTGGPKQDRVPE